MENRDFDWCMKKAISYVSRYLCSEQKLRDYLSRKGCSEFIDKIVKKLVNSKVLDEVSALDYYLGVYTKKYGKDMVKQKLIAKGFRKELVEKALDAISDEDEISLAEKIARSKLQRLARDLSPKEKMEKVYRHLLYRGINRNTAYKVVRMIAGKEINPDE